MKNKAVSKAISSLVAGLMSITNLSINYSVNQVYALNSENKLNTTKVIGDSARLLNGDVNNDGSIDSKDAEAVLKVKLADCPQADVNADNKLDQTDSDMIVSFTKGEINYFPVGTYYDETAGFMTRGEWIHNLVTGFEMSTTEDSELQDFYTDLKDHKYGSEITLAANFGVFDVLGDKFNPDEYVTRDFAAHTMNFCLGYSDNINISFKDKNKVYYAGDAQIALNNKWFTTENNEFRPSLYVKASEAEIAFKDMEEAAKATSIDEKHNNSIVYADKVKIVDDAKKISLNDNEIWIYGSSIALEEGDNFAFSFDGIEMVRKINHCCGISDDSIGYIVDPADDDVIKECDIEGYAQVDYDNIVLYGEETSPSPKSAPPSINSEHMLNHKVKSDINVGDIPINRTYDFGNGGKISLTGGITNIKIPYEVKIGLNTHLYIGVNANANLTATYSNNYKVSNPVEIPLGKIPIAGAGNLSASINVTAQVSLSGEVTLSYSCSMSAGVDYTLGKGWRAVKNFSGQKLTLDAKVEEQIGIQCSLDGKASILGSFRIYGEIGEKGKFTTNTSSDSNVTCANLSAHLYAYVGYNINPANIHNFGDSFTIYNEGNSPCRINYHWENGELVPKCTQGHGYITTNALGGGSIGGGSSGGYISGYGYSTGYSDGINYYSALGKFYQSSIAFRELNPALIISEDRMLTDDLEVETDLIIRAKLDLNGHKLTAKKNMYVGDIYDGIDGHWENEGELILNKGTLIVEGNLSESLQSQIIMDNKSDKITVNGNTKIDGKVTMTAGTLELKGDFNGKLDSSDMHIVLLSGTGNQSISGNEDNDIRVNLLDINNSDSRTITVNNRLKVESATTIDGKALHLICNESRNDKSYVSFGKLNADKLIIDGNVTLGSLEYKGTEITINGDLLGSDSTTLYKTKVTVTGDAVTGGDFNLNGSSLTIQGDYNHNGFLYMKNKNDKLTIEGDLHLEGTGDSIQDGIIDVKGDIRLSHIIHTYIFERYNELGGNNKVILSGEKDVTIYMDGGNFNDIEFQNSDKRTLYTDDTFKAASINCGTNPLNISTRNGVLGLGTVTCSDFKVDGDCTLIGETKFVCDSITFDGDISTGNNWDGTSINLNGKPTTINGSLTNNEPLYLNGATLTIKEDFNMPKGFLFVSKGKLYVLGDMTVDDGLITMKDNSDLIDVKGDFNVNCNVNNSGGDGVVSAGTIQCSGDYSNKGDYPLKMNGTSKLILNGDKDQVVHTKDSANQIIIENSANKKLIIKGNFAAKELSADNDTLAIESNGGIINGAKLKCNLNIIGNVILENADEHYVNTCVFDLNGHNVNINGSLYQHSGEIALNNGKLSIIDDYLILRDEDSAAHTVSNGKLNMTHNADNIIIGGDFVTMTDVDHSNLLTSGTMEIKGNFYQYDDGTKFAFPASGTHQAILSGEKTQEITFESYDSSHFNNLNLTKEQSKYVFSPEKCWNKIENKTSNTTTTTITKPTTTTTKPTTTSTTATTTATKPATTSTTATTTTTKPTTTSTTNTTTTSVTTTSNNSEFKLDITSVTLNNGNQYEIPLNYSDVTYKSTNTAVAVVSPKGVITAVGEGEAIINIIDKDYNVIQLKIAVKSGSTTSDEYEFGDVNGDGHINAVDASSVLSYYAMISTNQDGGYDDKQKAAADVNHDGQINAVDASCILSYYAYVSTTNEEILSIEAYLKKK